MPSYVPASACRSFNNLYTLEGGIQNYMREEGLDHWNGSLFVFDGRMAIRPSECCQLAREQAQVQVQQRCRRGRWPGKQSQALQGPGSRQASSPPISCKY